GFVLDLDGIWLVQFSLDEDAVSMTERRKLQAKAMGMKYLDIIDAPSNFGQLFQKTHFSCPLFNSTLVHNIFSLLFVDKMRAVLETFTSFRTRHYNSDTGKARRKIRN
ncbi:hypothetical protein B0H11DRAFT_1735855, partial [Mycena galericulata]